MLNAYDATVETLSALWGTDEFSTMDFTPMKPPFTDPIRQVAWHVRAEPRRHLHVQTIGLSELLDKETTDPTRSGFGVELSLRLALDADDELTEWPHGGTPTEWPRGSVETLQTLGRVFFGARRRLDFDGIVPCATPYSADSAVTGLRWSDLSFDEPAVEVTGDGCFAKAVAGTAPFSFTQLAPGIHGVAGNATGLVFDKDPELDPIECATGRIEFWSVLGYRLRADDPGTDVVARTRTYLVGAMHPRDADEWTLSPW